MKSEQQDPGDGSLQVVIAIASVTNLVTIDALQQPFAVNPANLGDLTFNDAAVAIDDRQMPIFRANLKVLLRTIASDIDRIPDNSNQAIATVAEFVRLALMAQA